MERLISTCSPAEVGNISSEELVISEALVKLQTIRDALFSDETDASTTRVADYLYQPGYRRTINILLDLIVLEGIYPHVSPGVGIPLQHRVRSLLPEGAFKSGIMPQESAVETSSNIFLLEKIADALLCLLKPNGKEFRELVEDRILSDVVAATMELAYGPTMGDQTTRLRFQGCIRSFIAEYVSILHSPGRRKLGVRLESKMAFLQFTVENSDQTITEIFPAAARLSLVSFHL